MTLNDLYPRLNSSFPVAGPDWGSTQYNSQQAWNRMPASEDQRNTAYTQQASDLARKIYQKGSADSAQRKLMFLQQFANRPVNLFGAPQDQAQQQLQDIVQQDYNARQAGVNQMKSFQDQSNALAERRQRFQAAQGNLADQALNHRLLQQRVNEKFDPNSPENQSEKLRLQALTQSNQSGSQSFAEHPLNQLLSAMQNGVAYSETLPGMDKLTPQQKLLVKGYGDSYARSAAAQAAIHAAQTAAVNERLHPTPNPNEIRLSNEALNRYGQDQGRADILAGDAQKYTQAAQAPKSGFLDSLWPAMKGLGSFALGNYSPENISAMTAPIQSFLPTGVPDNSANVVSQFKTAASPGFANNYVNNSLTGDPIASRLIQRGSNGLESLLALPPQQSQQPTMASPDPATTADWMRWQNRDQYNPLLNGAYDPVGMDNNAGLTQEPTTGAYLVKSQADVDMVPAGATFITPSGRRKIKPASTQTSGFLNSIRQGLPAPYIPESQGTYFNDRGNAPGPQRTFFGSDLNPVPY